jgi:hypothetical protein
VCIIGESDDGSVKRQRPSTIVDQLGKDALNEADKIAIVIDDGAAGKALRNMGADHQAGVHQAAVAGRSGAGNTVRPHQNSINDWRGEDRGHSHQPKPSSGVSRSEGDGFAEAGWDTKHSQVNTVADSDNLYVVEASPAGITCDSVAGLHNVSIRYRQPIRNDHGRPRDAEEAGYSRPENDKISGGSFERRIAHLAQGGGASCQEQKRRSGQDV